VTNDPRWHVRTQIAVVLRSFAAQGFEWGTAGHVTVRDPEDPSLFWVNPLGIPFGLTRAGDIVLVDSDGIVVAGEHPIAGFAGQYPIHEAFVDENQAVVHVHSPYGFMWSSSPAPLKALDDDSCAIAGLQAILPDLFDDPRAVLDRETRILIRKGHGFVTAGRTAYQAAFYLMAAERAAKAQLILESHGRFEEASAERVSRWRMTPEMAEEEFAPHAGWILGTQPDVAR
jgi:ribulose-5-phosphate 4-epimerase/fuculose-1-phosphate aldolase